eukprot:7672686-Lingulodinium_polyedra.AAC.1
MTFGAYCETARPRYVECPITPRKTGCFSSSVAHHARSSPRRAPTAGSWGLEGSTPCSSTPFLLSPARQLRCDQTSWYASSARMPVPR